MRRAAGLGGGRGGSYAFDVFGLYASAEAADRAGCGGSTGGTSKLAVAAGGEVNAYEEAWYEVTGTVYGLCCTADWDGLYGSYADCVGAAALVVGVGFGWYGS